MIKREKKTIFTLYLITQKRQKKVASLADLIEKVRKAALTDISIVDFITVLIQSIKKKKKGAFSYIYKTILYDIRISLKIGIDNAYTTALICGFLGTVSSSLSAVFNNKRHAIRIKIEPLFSKQIFSIMSNCIITLAPANIIIGYVIYKKYHKRR